jgi:hypothetical protein
VGVATLSKRFDRIGSESNTAILILLATVACALIDASPLIQNPILHHLFLHVGIGIAAVMLGVLLIVVLALLIRSFFAAVSRWRVTAIELFIRRAVTNIIQFERVFEFCRGRAPRRELRSFLKGLCRHYVGTTPPQTLAEQCVLSLKLNSQPIQLELQRHGDNYVLVAVTFNREGLGAEITDVFDDLRINITTWVATTNSANVGVCIVEFEREVGQSPTKIQHLLRSVHDHLSGRFTSGRTRRTQAPVRLRTGQRYGQTSVCFDDSCSGHSTLLKVMASDRLGLLHKITGHIAHNGCDIRTVFAETKGGMAVDYFYVTKHGKKLDATMKSSLGETLLMLLDG